MIMTLQELFSSSDQFSAKALDSVGRLIDQYRQGVISKEVFLRSAQEIANKTSEPRIMLAFIKYHPSFGAPNKQITIQI